MQCWTVRKFWLFPQGLLPLKYKGLYPGRFSKWVMGALRQVKWSKNQSRFTKSSLFQGLQCGNSAGKMGRWLSKQNHIRPQGNQKYRYFENYNLKKTQQTNKQRTSTRDRGLCYKDLNFVEEMLKRIFAQAKHNHTQKNLNIWILFWNSSGILGTLSSCAAGI